MHQAACEQAPPGPKSPARESGAVGRETSDDPSIPTSFARVLVLGLGNDILTDDAIGLRVAAAVRGQLAGTPDIEVKATTEMGLALLDEIAGRQAVVLVDSVQTGKAPPGFIHELAAEDLSRVLTTSPHFLGIGETLALGKMLGLSMPQQVRIFAIEVVDPFTLGTSMTPAVAAALAPAAGRVADQARAFAGVALNTRPGAGNCGWSPIRQTAGSPPDSAGRPSC
jgi:hydrogenase maturation protease